ncbi:MAG TPA: hypothetical protein VMF59_16485 [Bacteroidota bacterium]|nr:hypothetical protein [Bacteroidota bacterium]
MNCEEFRERCHVLIDARTGDLADAGMLAHREGCPACAEFFRSMIAVDAGLREIPREPVPAPLMHSLRQIGEEHARPSPGWKPDLEVAARYLVPGLLLWGAQWMFPESARPYLSAAITFIGVFIVVTSTLRTRLLGSSAPH